MTPIHELLHRIRWDPEFGRGQFQLGYFDRMENGIVTVTLQEVDFPKDDPHAFVLKDAEGRCHRVPLHRVREVYKDGRRIWQRPQKADEP